MYVFRVEKDGETFYVQADRLQHYYDEGYALYGQDTEQRSGGGGIQTQSVDDSSEYEITASNLAAQIAAGVAESTHTA